MPQQQASNGWTPVDDSKAPAGWTPVEQTSTGISVPQGMIGPSVNDPNAPDTIVGGAFRRGKEAIKGMVGLVGPPTDEEMQKGQVPLPLHRLGRGIASAEKEAAGQVGEQFKGAVSAAKAGDPVAAGLRGAQAVTTGLSMANPFAIGPVTNINRLSGQKRYREALGQGAFDAITLLAGKKTGEEPTPIKSTNKLSFATDAAPRDIAHVLPELKETAEKLGKPKTIGDVGTHLQSTLTRLDQKFNAGLFSNAHRQLVPQAIADELRSRAAEMPPSPDGQAMAQQLNNAASTYERPWTLRELNAERKLRSGYLKGFYGKEGSAQMAAMRTSADTIIDKTVEGGAKDLLYDELDRLHPGGGFRELKQKQSALIDIKDAFDKHLEKIEKQSAQEKGAPFLGKSSVTASASQHGVIPRLHNFIPKRDPLSLANSAARTAYGPSSTATAARSAILAMPVTSLVGGNGSGMPPPPSDSDQQ